MKKVILVAFYFNQINEIASKRLRALAKYLPRFGWEPIVIVPDLGFVPEENKNLNCRIITTEYEDMFSHFSKKFKLGSNSSNSSNSSNGIDNFHNENNNDIDKLNSSGSKVNNDVDKLRDSDSVSNPLISNAISIAGEIFAYPDGMKYWYGPAYEKISEIVENEKIDAIISSSWPITCHTIAKDISDKYNIPWVADLRDLWNLNPYVSHTFIRNYFEKRLELKTFENTDVLTTTTGLAKETLATLHPNNRIEAIFSGYDEDDFDLINFNVNNNHNNHNNHNDGSNNNNINSDVNSNINSNINEEDDKNNKLKFIYAGSLYGGKRDPTVLFESISQLEEESKIDSSNISIEFYGDNDNLEEIANKFNLSQIVKIGGRISHNEVLKKQMESDILLLISWNNEKEKMFIPGKIYEYFALKKPVLSIGYKEGSLKDLIEETKVGYHVSNLEDTKKVLSDIYNQFEEEGEFSLKTEINIDDYSMVTMASKFSNILNDISN